jgi:hypothetical protein
MKMKKTTLLMVVALTLSGAGCRWMGIRGNGHITTEEREIQDFSEIESTGSFDVEWKSGAPSLTITTDENLMSHIRTDVEDGKLRLRTHERMLPTHGLKVTVSSTTRTGARLTGASELRAADLTGDSFAIETTGAADLRLAGNIDHLLADMRGASDLKGKSLQTRTAEISTTGAAQADISVSESLKVTITGAGEVTYHGNPTVQKRVVGAGEVHRKD